mmetsp:Transcript_1711/g.5128  ORF Transcript_1711/g.5128 Transcript_1711/m.5128 type:complete len:431 (+) Transcript_1711:123-1415(+)
MPHALSCACSSTGFPVLAWAVRHMHLPPVARRQSHTFPSRRASTPALLPSSVAASPAQLHALRLLRVLQVEADTARRERRRVMRRAQDLHVRLDEIVDGVLPARAVGHLVVPVVQLLLGMEDLHPAGGHRQRDGEVGEPDEVGLGEGLDGELEREVERVAHQARRRGERRREHLLEVGAQLGVDLDALDLVHLGVGRVDAVVGLALIGLGHQVGDVRDREAPLGLLLGCRLSLRLHLSFDLGLAPRRHLGRLVVGEAVALGRLLVHVAALGALRQLLLLRRRARLEVSRFGAHAAAAAAAARLLVGGRGLWALGDRLGVGALARGGVDEDAEAVHPRRGVEAVQLGLVQQPIDDRLERLGMRARRKVVEEDGAVRIDKLHPPLGRVRQERRHLRVGAPRAHLSLAAQPAHHMLEVRRERVRLLRVARRLI